ncbi:hypothetical protein EYF80_012923 [Liparis tanakae]|uniref:Uncharacterized protein n=1 Tax=Liparis tanakae TaxID=230148 RepID=A0A4Z2IG13_9TELE|nr:hypothetical protein EYF80_012923 [Liparis tanakae]
MNLKRKNMSGIGVTGTTGMSFRGDPALDGLWSAGPGGGRGEGGGLRGEGALLLRLAVEVVELEASFKDWPLRPGMPTPAPMFLPC